MMKTGILFLALLGVTLAAFTCKDQTTVYDWPHEVNCRYYYHCEKGELTEHSCFILFRKFNPEKLSCDWAWRVNCEAKPVEPTSSPIPEPTQAPVTDSSRVPVPPSTPKVPAKN